MPKSPAFGCEAGIDTSAKLLDLRQLQCGLSAEGDEVRGVEDGAYGLSHSIGWEDDDSTLLVLEKFVTADNGDGCERQAAC
jgi:hypothetical protein